MNGLLNRASQRPKYQWALTCNCYPACGPSAVLHLSNKSLSGTRCNSCPTSPLSHIVFFTCTTTLGWILMISNLRSQGFVLVNLCCLCNNNEETINHLLIHCEYTSDLWPLVLNLFGVLWALPSNILELLYFWKTQGWGHSQEATATLLFRLLQEPPV